MLPGLVTSRTNPEPYPDPGFTKSDHWTDFFGSWCEPGQPGPHIGFQGEGEARSIVALHAGLVLSSVFQPIFSLAPLQPLAFEALVRARSLHTGQAVSPDTLFSRPGTPAHGILLDRICRFIHMLNFQAQSPQNAALYLNIATTHLQAMTPGRHGTFLGALQALCPLEAKRIILEITETGFDDREALGDIVQSFKSRGYRVAIDDFGARHSNFDRLWALEPDIVKIDRELLLQADINARARKVLPKVVEIIHDLEATVVCEGIETPRQHQLAQVAGVDLVQGFLFAQPNARLRPQEN